MTQYQENTQADKMDGRMEGWTDPSGYCWWSSKRKHLKQDLYIYVIFKTFFDMATNKTFQLND